MSITVSAKVLANRAARRDKEGKRFAAMSAALASLTDEETYEIDSKGRKVRQSRPMYEEVRTFLLRKRVVDTVEVLEEMGQLAFDALVRFGYIKKDARYNPYKTSNMFWITTKARDHYKLPERIHLVTDMFADYVEA